MAPVSQRIPQCAPSWPQRGDQHINSGAQAVPSGCRGALSIARPCSCESAKPQACPPAICLLQTVKRFQECQHIMVSWGKASRVSAAQSSKSRQLPPTLPSPSLEKVEAAEALVTFYGASIRSVCAPLPRFLYAYARSGSLGPAALLNALARGLTTINHSS